MSLFRNVVIHLHGETPHLRDIIAVYLLAGAVGITFILSCSEKNVSDWLMALLAADLAGGIISNATASTRAHFENKVSGRAAAFFFTRADLPSYNYRSDGPDTHLGYSHVSWVCHKNMFTRGPRPDSYLR